MTANLIAFLRARLDEDEAVARAASPGPWRPDEEGDEVLAVDGIVVAEGFALSGRQLRATVDHIARHDPARVLAEVEAKRRIVQAHAKWCEGRCEAKYPEGGFDAAHYWSVKSLAAVYADHPDYREGWRP
ncbi:DUF6221 family protein [Streptomyces albidoflavus]